jgi:hypothetical protein
MGVMLAHLDLRGFVGRMNRTLLDECSPGPKSRSHRISPKLMISSPQGRAIIAAGFFGP